MFHCVLTSVSQREIWCQSDSSSFWINLFYFSILIVKSYSKVSPQYFRYKSFSIHPILHSVGYFENLCFSSALGNHLPLLLPSPCLIISLHFSLSSSRMPVIQAESVKNVLGFKWQKTMLTVFKQISRNFFEVNGQKWVTGLLFAYGRQISTFLIKDSFLSYPTSHPPSTPHHFTLF